MEIEDIFIFSNLTACIFGTTGSSETLCTSFERSDQWQSGPKSSRVRQHFYPLPCPFEKSHFTPKKGLCPISAAHQCKTGI